MPMEGAVFAWISRMKFWNRAPKQNNELYTRIGCEELKDLQHVVRNALVGARVEHKKMLKGLSIASKAYEDQKTFLDKMEDVLRPKRGV